MLDGLGLEFQESKIRVRVDVKPLVSEYVDRISTSLAKVNSVEVDGTESEVVAAKSLLEDYEVERSLQIVRRAYLPRWEDAVPCRIGSRMGRPEKSGAREMSPWSIQFSYWRIRWTSRLVSEAAKGTIMVVVGPRYAKNVDDRLHVTCHHRIEEGSYTECGGRTIPLLGRRAVGVRKGPVNLSSVLEVKRRRLGLDRLPEKIKA